jgi:hypothetical protein
MTVNELIFKAKCEENIFTLIYINLLNREKLSNRLFRADEDTRAPTFHGTFFARNQGEGLQACNIDKQHWQI